MPLSSWLYLGLLASVGIVRLIELRLSRRNQRAMRERGVALADEPAFRWMVVLHTAVLAGAAIEVVVLRRPFVPALGVPALAALVAANLLRWWVIAALGARWNVRVTRSIALGVVADGPFRYVRHPNYVAVFVELLALPLVHGALVTAALGTALHVAILRRRIALEESILLGDPGYRAAMGPKPRFVPRPWTARPTS